MQKGVFWKPLHNPLIFYELQSRFLLVFFRFTANRRLIFVKLFSRLVFLCLWVLKGSCVRDSLYVFSSLSAVMCGEMMRSLRSDSREIINHLIIDRRHYPT